jgi:hypothetical protein
LRSAVSGVRKSLIAVAHLGRNFSSDAAGMMFKSDIYLCARREAFAVQTAHLSKVDISGIGVGGGQCHF